MPIPPPAVRVLDRKSGCRALLSYVVVRSDEILNSWESGRSALMSSSLYHIEPLN